MSDKPTINPHVEHLAVMHVDYGITRQAEPYTSIKASVTIPVYIRPGDDALDLLDQTLEAARFRLQDEIDDEFESYDQPAPYSPEPRYVCRRTLGTKIIAILPQHAADLPPVWGELPYEYNGHRLSYILNKLERKSGHTIIDCSDGDFTKLPKLVACVVAYSKAAGLVVVSLRENELPREIKEQYAPMYSWGRTHEDDTPDKVWLNAIEIGEKYGATYVFDCRDGDWSKLPPPPPPAAPEPTPAADFEDEDDDYYDEDDDSSYGE